MKRIARKKGEREREREGIQLINFSLLKMLNKSANQIIR